MTSEVCNTVMVAPHSLTSGMDPVVTDPSSSLWGPNLEDLCGAPSAASASTPHGGPDLMMMPLDQPHSSPPRGVGHSTPGAFVAQKDQASAAPLFALLPDASDAIFDPQSSPTARTPSPPNVFAQMQEEHQNANLEAHYNANLALRWQRARWMAQTALTGA